MVVHIKTQELTIGSHDGLFECGWLVLRSFFYTETQQFGVPGADGVSAA